MLSMLQLIRALRKLQMTNTNISEFANNLKQAAEIINPNTTEVPPAVLEQILANHRELLMQHEQLTGGLTSVLTSGAASIRASEVASAAPEVAPATTTNTPAPTTTTPTTTTPIPTAPTAAAAATSEAKPTKAPAGWSSTPPVSSASEVGNNDKKDIASEVASVSSNATGAEMQTKSTLKAGPAIGTDLPISLLLSMLATHRDPTPQRRQSDALDKIEPNIVPEPRMVTVASVATKIEPTFVQETSEITAATHSAINNEPTSVESTNDEAAPNGSTSATSTHIEQKPSVIDLRTQRPETVQFRTPSMTSPSATNQNDILDQLSMHSSVSTLEILLKKSKATTKLAIEATQLTQSNNNDNEQQQQQQQSQTSEQSNQNQSHSQRQSQSQSDSGSQMKIPKQNYTIGSVSINVVTPTAPLSLSAAALESAKLLLLPKPQPNKKSQANEIASTFSHADEHRRLSLSQQFQTGTTINNNNRISETNKSIALGAKATTSLLARSTQQLNNILQQHDNIKQQQYHQIHTDNKKSQTKFSMSSLAAEPLVHKPDEMVAQMNTTTKAGEKTVNGGSSCHMDNGNASTAQQQTGLATSTSNSSASSATGKPCFNTGLAEILQFMELIGNLKHTKRTGWVLRDVSDCESISGHMYRMSVMTFLLDGSEGLNQIRCMELALVHDLAESLVGDITPFCGVTKEQKRNMEFKAMEDICKLIEPRGKRIMELFEEYEHGESPESRFVKDLDRLDMIMQAFEYEKRDDCLLKHQEFFDSTEGKFNHPFVKKLVNEIYEQRKEMAKARGATPPPTVHVPDMNEPTTSAAAPVATATINGTTPTTNGHCTAAELAEHEARASKSHSTSSS